MPYTPNNPYIPGDPYSYDLKWIISQLKTILSSVESLEGQIPTSTDIRNIVSSMLGEAQLNIVNVKSYGAAGDGVTDDLAAIVNAYNYAASVKGWLYFPDGTYLISDTLEIPSYVNVLCDGTIHFIGQADAVKVGTAGSSYGRAIQIWKITGLNALNSNSAGLHLINTNACLIVPAYIAYFEKALILEGDGAGCQNNIIITEQIGESQKIVTLTSSNGGWCNENLFLGGRFFSLSNPGYNVDGITITSDGNRTQNNNVFIKPNLENAENAIIIDYGLQNYFYDVRTESVTTSLTINNGGQNNLIEIGYGTAAAYYPFNEIRNPRVRDRMMHASTSYIVNNIGASAARTGSYSSSIAGAKILNASGIPSVKADITITPNADGSITVPSGRYIGQVVHFDPADKPVFDFMPFTDVNTRGIVFFYDSTNTLITDTPDFPVEATAALFTANTAQGWRYSAARHFMINPPANAVSAFIAFQTTASTKFTGFRIIGDAPFYADTNNCCLSTAPTEAGVINGQTCYDDTGTVNGWIWNGTSWSSF